MKYKIGLLYVKEGQTDENDMFSNGGEDTPTQDFEDFLRFIGERVTLMGFQKFRGGLDIKANTTGTESVYTTHNNLEIMVKTERCLLI